MSVVILDFRTGNVAKWPPAGANREDDGDVGLLPVADSVKLDPYRDPSAGPLGIGIVPNPRRSLSAKPNSST